MQILPIQTYRYGMIRDVLYHGNSCLRIYTRTNVGGNEGKILLTLTPTKGRFRNAPFRQSDTHRRGSSQAKLIALGAIQGTVPYTKHNTRVPKQQHAEVSPM